MESHNPYAVGEAALATPPERFTGEIASKWRRFGTMLIDYVFYYIFCAILGVIAGLTLGERALEGGGAYLISISALLVYYAGFEGTLGRTPAKFLLGTRVVTNDGGAPSFGQAIGRTLARMIPFEPFSVLFAREGNAIGWHDAIARTKVVRVR
jgi:uncharacterized RDD family membrane protein YckC